MHDLEEERNRDCCGSENAGNSRKEQLQKICRVQWIHVEPCNEEHKEYGHEIAEQGKGIDHWRKDFAVGFNLMQLFLVQLSLPEKILNAFSDQRECDEVVCCSCSQNHGPAGRV